MTNQLQHMTEPSVPDQFASRVKESRFRLVESVRRDPLRAPVNASYSRFVGLMKLVLPLSAVVLSALVIIWPHLSGHEDGFKIEMTDIGIDKSNATYMSNARYFATDKESQPYTITANAVHEVSGVEDQFKLVSPKADVLLNTGEWIALTANGGILDRKNEVLVLNDGVSVFSDTGYEFRTQDAEIDLRTTEAMGNSAIEGQGSLGILNASGFRIRDSGESVLFLGRVHLVLYPKSET